MIAGWHGQAAALGGLPVVTPCALVTGTPRRTAACPGHTRQARGSVLMEVVIALSLFFVAGVFIMDGLNSSIRGVQTIKLEADAADLAVTTFSEVQMGLTPLENAGPVGVAFSGAEGWTYELVVEPVEEMTDMPQLKRLHVIVRNDANDFTYRTSHLVWDNPNPPQEMQQQLEQGLAGEIIGGGGLGGGAPTGPGGAAGGGTNPRGPFPDATPQFPPRGGAGNQPPTRGGAGNNGNGRPPDATPQFPPRGGNGNPQPPNRGGAGNGNNANGNNGRTPDATPRFPPRDGGNTGRGGEGRPTPPPAPPADEGQSTPQPQLDENGNPIPPRTRQGGGR